MKKNMDLETTGTMEETMKSWKPNRAKKNLLPIVIATIVSLTILISGIVSEYGMTSSVSNVTSVKAEAAVQPKGKGVIKVEPQKKTTSSNVVSVNKTPDTDESDSKWHFFNQDIQDDGTAKNDYNFGPNPVMDDPEMVEKLKKMLSTKGIKDSISIEELVGEVSPEIIDKNFRERLRQDPALGAACMAWFDSILGTRYLGTFYSAAKEQWDVAMNDAKEEFMADPDKYDKTLKAFFKYLDSATKVEIKRQKTGLTDQMYMNPYTVDEVPDIVVMESADHAGWFIVYHFEIKETAKKEVSYRLDCGYQPTNVAKIMKVKAKKNPNKKVVVSKPVTPVAPVVSVTPIVPGVPVITGGGSGGHGGGGGGGSTPTPTPTPTPPNPDPSNPKDPSKGTPVLPNDDPGPGPDTNNPADPNHSTADQPTNSDHMTHEEYHQAMQENHEANESTGRSGGESNEPSSSPSDSGGDGGGGGESHETHVDNNGDSGTGHGGADHPTEHHESSVSHDPAGSHWDGPSD